MQNIWGWLNVTHLQFYLNVITRGLLHSDVFVEVQIWKKKKSDCWLGIFTKKKMQISLQNTLQTEVDFLEF